MFFVISKILAFLIRPITWIFILLLVSFLFKKRRPKLLFFSIITFWFFSNAFICDEIARIWEYKSVKIENVKKNFNVGIVLGGMSEYDFNSKMLNFNKHADRLIFTEQLYHKGVIEMILISGGSGMLLENEYKEANAMKNHLIKNGVTANDIIIENNSRNTKENAFLSAKILNRDFKNKSVLLITSALHMRRAIFCFEKAGIRATPFPTDNTNSKRNFQIDYLLLPNSESFEKWESIIHELIGYIVYKVAF